MKRKYLLVLGCWLITLLSLFSCMKDESFTNSPSRGLQFSSDTVRFDTVFTTIGSVTEGLIVYNNNSEGVRLTSVRLASNGNSGFRVNVDGNYGTQFSDVEIYGEDSIFVFVEVTVDPQNSDSPILITDSLLFSLPNGITQKVILEAYGQDAIIIKGMTVTADTLLSSPRPYIIYDSVRVDKGATLNIDSATTLYFHDKAQLLVHGNVKARGTVNHPVVFRGDRLDWLLWYVPYDNVDALWGGIHIYPESTENIFDHCDIHSGTYGIKVDKPISQDTSLTLTNSVIHNVAGHALELNECKAIIGNCQITNVKGDCIHAIGGDIQVHFSTIAQFYPWDECGHALNFSNARGDTLAPVRNLFFNSCILTGYANDEIFGTIHDDSTDSTFNYRFAYSLLLTDSNAIDMSRCESCIFESDTAFSKNKNFRDYLREDYSSDFRLDSISKARNHGSMKYAITPSTTIYATDRLGLPRPQDTPDAGCYQYR